MQNGITLAAQQVGARQKAYDRVFFENGGYQPYLYVVSYTGMRPRKYMEVPKEMGASPTRMDIVRRVDKYFFSDSLEIIAQAAESAAGGRRDLFVARRKLPELALLDSVAWQWQRYYVMEPKPR